MLFLAVLSLLVFVWGSLDAKVKFLILSTEVLLLVMSRHPILANILDSLHHRHLVEDALVLAPVQCVIFLLMDQMVQIL
ncbi:hypothetical protein LINPERHAP1_LOCUS32489 [Linum perenne]